MQKIEFENDKYYQLDISNSISYGSINISVLCDIYKDGRISGLINEHLIVSIFDNLVLAPSKKSAFDVMDKIFGTTYEVKGVTDKGTKTCPSSMIGAGRKYNSEKHMEKLINIDYFLFMDIRKFPKINMIPISTNNDLLLVQNISSKKFDNIVSSLHHENITTLII